MTATTNPSTFTSAAPAAPTGEPPRDAVLDFEAVQSFLSRVVTDLGGAMIGLVCALGDRLGLFRALAAAGPCTSEQLARHCRMHERPIREWLCAVASAGYVVYDPARASYRLPPEHALVLAHDHSPMFLGGGFQQLLGLVRPFDMLCDAFRHGGGVPQQAYGEDLVSGMERMSATWFDNMLVQHWLPTTQSAVDRLEHGVDVADVGCGSGRALLALARSFPRSRFVGFDRFEPVVARATARAEAAGLHHRVRFEVRSVEDGLPDRYDLITAFDSLHDMSDPAGALRAIHRALDPRGALLIMEMNCAERLEDNFGPSGVILYGTSALYNTPVTLAQGRDALGTMALPERAVRELCTAAGFASIRRLPVMNPFNSLYEALPE
jgi:SAM-dependent methyltransferase